MARKAKKRKTDYTFSDTWKITKPLAKGEVQCRHTTKPHPARLCSICSGAVCKRAAPEPTLPAPEAQPTRPHKHEGC